jgi:hypothetical protein
MNWMGNTPPTSEAIAGHRVIEQGNTHLKAIWETGGELLGWRSLDEDSIAPGLFLSHSGGPGVKLMKGYEILRPATRAEIASVPVLSTWGYNVIRILAEKHLGGR